MRDCISKTNILKFNNHEVYKIHEGDNNNLKSIITLGYPIDVARRNKFQFYSSFIRIYSVGQNN